MILNIWATQSLYCRTNREVIPVADSRHRYLKTENQSLTLKATQTSPQCSFSESLFTQ